MKIFVEAGVTEEPHIKDDEKFSDIKDHLSVYKKGKMTNVYLSFIPMHQPVLVMSSGVGSKQNVLKHGCFK